MQEPFDTMENVMLQHSRIMAVQCPDACDLAPAIRLANVCHSRTGALAILYIYRSGPVNSNCYVGHFFLRIR